MACPPRKRKISRKPRTYTFFSFFLILSSSGPARLNMVSDDSERYLIFGLRYLSTPPPPARKPRYGNSVFCSTEFRVERVIFLIRVRKFNFPRVLTPKTVFFALKKCCPIGIYFWALWNNQEPCRQTETAEARSARAVSACLQGSIFDFDTPPYSGYTLTVPDHARLQDQGESRTKTLPLFSKSHPSIGGGGMPSERHGMGFVKVELMPLKSSAELSFKYTSLWIGGKWLWKFWMARTENIDFLSVQHIIWTTSTGCARHKG